MENETKVKDFTLASGLKCRYCGQDGLGTYMECVDGGFTCGKCWLDKMTLHAHNREETIKENVLKKAPKATKKSTTKKRRV